MYGVVFLQLLDIEDGFLSLMDDTGNTRDDLKVPEGDIGEEIQREYGDGKDLLVRNYLNLNSSFYRRSICDDQPQTCTYNTVREKSIPNLKFIFFPMN